MLTHRARGPHQGPASSCTRHPGRRPEVHRLWLQRNVVSTVANTGVRRRSARLEHPALCVCASTRRQPFHSGRVGHRAYTGAGTILHTGDIKFDHCHRTHVPPITGHVAALGDTGVGLSCATRRTPRSPVSGHRKAKVNAAPVIRVPTTGDSCVFRPNVDRVQIIDAAVALGRRVSFVEDRWQAQHARRKATGLLPTSG